MNMEQTPDTAEQQHKWDSGNQKQITGLEMNTTWDCKEDLIDPIMFSFGGHKLEMAKYIGRQELQLQGISLLLYSVDGIRLMFKVSPILWNWTLISKMHSLEQLAQVVELLCKSWSGKVIHQSCSTRKIL